MGTTIGLTGAGEPVALESDLAATNARVDTLWAKVFGGGLTPSPTGTFVTAPNPTAPIVDDALDQWFLVPATGAGKTGFQIATIAKGAQPPAKVDPPTNAVVDLGIQLVGGVRHVVQKNATGQCYYATTPGAWISFGGPVPP